MKTLVLDATELRADLLLRSARFKLIANMWQETWINVVIPASVLEETVANYGRQVADLRKREHMIHQDRVRLGLKPSPAIDDDFDYRSFLLEHLDEKLGIKVLPWPEVDHPTLVDRAVRRVPPFDSKGDGYRDSLVWFSVLNLASQGVDVALVTKDNDFCDSSGELSSVLTEEIRGLSGSVEIVSDLASWLLENLPWRAATIDDALAVSQDHALESYLLQSDLLWEVMPDASALELPGHVYSASITDCQWESTLERVAAPRMYGDSTTVDYRLEAEVEYEAIVARSPRIPHELVVEDGSDPFAVQIRGTTRLELHLTVLFEPDGDFSVDQLWWSHAGYGVPLHEMPSEVPGQGSLDLTP